MEIQQVKFNPGLDIAMEVSRIIKRCEHFCRYGMFAEWHTELEILRRRLYAKYCTNRDDSQVIEQARKGKDGVIRNFLSVQGTNSMSPIVMTRMYNFLISYEEVLRKYARKYGYDNPDQDDAGKAMFN